MIALIDADPLVYIAAWAAKDEPLFATAEMRNSIIRLLTSLKYKGATHAIFACGPDGSFMVKKAMYPTYKAKRTSHEDIMKSKAELQHMLREISVWHPGIEADDIIAKLAVTYKDNCLIVSNDKDLLNIPGTHSKLKDDPVFIVSEQEASMRFWTQMVVGDSSDNITGIAGAGPVAAAKILEYCITDKEREEAVIAAYIAKYKDAWLPWYQQNLTLLGFVDLDNTVLSDKNITPKTVDEWLELYA